MIILLFVFFSTYAYSYQTCRTIRNLNKTALDIANGNFESRVEVKDNSDFKELAETLNIMATRLGKLEQTRKDFIANISHDFRSPLTSIKGFVQAILEGIIPPESQERYLRIVLDETDRLANLTNEILLLAHLESSTAPPEKISFDLHQVIRKVVLQFEQKIIEKEIHLDMQLPYPHLYVFGDVNQIQRVIYNLTDNAIKFTQRNGIIRIKTETVKGKAKISIFNHGLEISEENLKYIWDRFHKGDRSRGIDRRGTGLGLSIVKEIINAHHQEVGVESFPGKGTTFYFTLDIYPTGSQTL